MLKGKNILVGVSGAIAVYKACTVVSRLKQLGADVNVIMTESATKFVAPLTFETLSGNIVVDEMFSEKPHNEVSHIALAKKADLFVIVPATADFLAKAACGIADDMLTTTFLAYNRPAVICPCMNVNMYVNPITQQNIAKLKSLGHIFIEPAEGFLACGDRGKGRLEEPEEIVRAISDRFTKSQDYCGKRVLITAGATREPIDGVRYLSNRSSGKMGIALAKAASERGADVTLIAGFVSVPLPDGVKVVRVETTKQMRDAVLDELTCADIVIKAAAPGDYSPKTYTEKKIKDVEISIDFIKNPDIAAEVGKRKGTRKLIVFSAETGNLIENAKKKLQGKNADMVVANDVTQEGAGFDCDTNIVTLIGKKGVIETTERLQKSVVAEKILDEILKL